MKRVLPIAPLALLLFILPYPGTVALRLLCLAAGFVIAIALWRESAPPPLPCKLPLALWAMVSLASVLYALDPSYSLGEIKNEVGYTMMAFVAFHALTRDGADLERLLLSLAAGAAVICLWILALRLSSGLWNEGAAHGGRGSFATYCVTLLPALMLLGFWFDARWQRIAAVVLGALVLLTGVYSQQRAIWPVIAAQGLIVFWMLSRGGVIRASARRALVAVAAIVLVTGTALFATQVQRLEIFGPTAVAVSGDSRVEQLGAIAARIIDKPLSGAGFGRQAMKQAHRDLIPSNNPLLWHAHNVLLNYGLAMGLPGIAALLLVYGCLLREYWRLARHSDRRLQLLGAAGVALVAGVLLRNQANDFFMRDMAILFWALNGALLGLGARLRRGSA
jgi:O-antigen ligase